MSKTLFVKDLKTGQIAEVSQYAFDFHMKNKTITVDRKPAPRYAEVSEEDYKADQAAKGISPEAEAPKAEGNESAVTAEPAKTFPVKTVAGAEGGANA